MLFQFEMQLCNRGFKINLFEMLEMLSDKKLGTMIQKWQLNYAAWRKTETEIETEMLVICPILNQNLDSIHLVVNGQTQQQIVLYSEQSESS